MVVSIGIDDVLGIHYKTFLEIAVKHIRRGDEVNLITCDKSLKTCPVNPNHEWGTCIMCKSMLRSGINIEEVSNARQHVLYLNKYRRDIEIPTFSSISELKNYEIDGVNHGMEAASTVISALRKPKPNMREHRDLVERSLFTAVSLYHAALEHIDKVDPDCLYVLNGRRASQMPFVRAAWAKDIDIYTFEVGHNKNKYVLVEGTYFHDLENKKREIEEYWNKEDSLKKKKKVAKEFYKKRRYGSGDKFPEAKFKEGQKKSKLPEGFDPEDRNVAIFNSSEDEFAAVRGYENPVYENQIEGLKRILEDRSISKNINFYLRVHPNLEGVKNYQTKEIKNIDKRNTKVINASSKVDSYALMEASDKVLTFGSAMSIESAYYGKPSILIGREPYEDLESCYTPDGHDEAIRAINNENLEPKSKLGAIKYGYYIVKRDIKYDVYSTDTEKFLGKNLEASRKSKRINYYLKNGLKSTIYNFLYRRLPSKLKNKKRQKYD